MKHCHRRGTVDVEFYVHYGYDKLLTSKKHENSPNRTTNEVQQRKDWRFWRVLIQVQQANKLDEY